MTNSTPYQDVQFLKKHGYWKNSKVPNWALKKCEELQTIPTHSSIIEWAYEHEIKRLKTLLFDITKDLSSI